MQLKHYVTNFCFCLCFRFKSRFTVVQEHCCYYRNNDMSTFITYKINYLKLQSVTFGAIAVNKQNCMRLVEEHCS